MPTSFGVNYTEGFTNALIFFESYPLPSLLINRSALKVVAVNTAATKLFHSTKQAITGLIFIDLLVNVDKVKILSRFQQSAIDAPWHDVVQLQRTGEILTTELHVQSLVYGNDVLHQVSLQDITNRYSKQEQLAASARRYKGFIEQNSEGIFCQEMRLPIPVNLPIDTIVERITNESYLSECNDALAHIYGYEYGHQMNGLLTKDLIDISDPANLEYVKSFVQNNFKSIGAESHEKDRFGQSVFFLNNAIGIVEDGALKRIWGTQRDITDVKEVEKKVKLLTDLVEQTSDVLTAADIDFKPITWNQAAEKVYGLTAQQVIGKSLRQYMDVHYNNATREEVRKSLEEKGSWRGEMYFIRPSDGKLVTLLAGFKTLFDENGSPLGYIISGTDITERKATEKRMRLLSSLVENTSEILIALDSNFTTMSWNSAAEHVLGIQEKQVLGKQISKCLPLHFGSFSNKEVRKQVDAIGNGTVKFILSGLPMEKR